MSRSFQITIDANDPDLLARFWMAALGYVETPPPAGFGSWREWYVSVGVPEEELDDGIDRIVAPDGDGPNFWFQPVPERKAGKNRLHLDIRVTDGRAEELESRKEKVRRESDRLIGLGATLLRVHDGEAEGHFAHTMADPEGNEFCLI